MKQPNTQKQQQPTIAIKPKLPNVQTHLYTQSRNHSLKKIPYYNPTNNNNNNQSQSLNSLGLFPKITHNSNKQKKYNNNNLTYINNNNNNNTKNIINQQTSLQKNGIKWHLPNNHLKKRQKLLTQTNISNNHHNNNNNNTDQLQQLTNDESFISLTSKLMTTNTQCDIKDTMMDFRRKIQLNRLFIKKEIEKKNKENNQSSLMVVKKEEWGRRKRVASSRFVNGSGGGEVSNSRGKVVSGYVSSNGNNVNNNGNFNSNNVNSNNNNINNNNPKQWQSQKHNKRTIQTPKNKLQTSVIKRDSSSNKKNKNKNNNNNNHHSNGNKQNQNQTNGKSNNTKRMSSKNNNYYTNTNTNTNNNNISPTTFLQQPSSPFNNINNNNDHHRRRQKTQIQTVIIQQQDMRSAGDLSASRLLNGSRQKYIELSLPKRKSEGLFGQLQGMLDDKMRFGDSNNNGVDVPIKYKQKYVLQQSVKLMQQQGKLRELLSRLYKHKSVSNNNNISYNSHGGCEQLLVLQSSCDDIMLLREREQQRTNSLISNVKNSNNNISNINTTLSNMKKGSYQQQWHKLQLQSASSQITYRKSSFQQELNKIVEYADRNGASLQKYLTMRKELIKLGFQVQGNSQNSNNNLKNNNNGNGNNVVKNKRNENKPSNNNNSNKNK